METRAERMKRALEELKQRLGSLVPQSRSHLRLLLTLSILAVSALFLPVRGLASSRLPVIAESSQRGSRSLQTLTPESVIVDNPSQNSTPSNFIAQLRTSQSIQAIRLFSQSTVTYRVPPSQKSFTAEIVYENSNALLVPAGNGDDSVQFEIFIDGQLASTIYTARDVPARRISVSTVGAQHISLRTRSHFGWDSIILLDPKFSAGASTSPMPYTLEPGQSYVSLPAAIEMFPILHPGLAVPICVQSSESIRNGQLTIEMTYANGERTSQSIQIGKYRDYWVNLDWTAPEVRGPARLRLQLQVKDRVMFERTLLVANTEVPGRSEFVGVHTSVSGIVFPQDSHAGEWGGGWARAAIRWSVVETAPGQFDFSRADEILQSFKKDGLRVLFILGEDSPAWVPREPTAFANAWHTFVQKAATHFAGRVDAWDIYNEVDVKYYDWMKTMDADADLRLLQDAITTVRSADSVGKIVCCSTGTAEWLGYYNRLATAGLLQQVDVVSIHPYQFHAPEQQDGRYNLEGAYQAVSDLLQKTGSMKPIWATEANWLLGKPDAPYVTSPNLNDHDQAVYLSRAVLISTGLGIPYFIHSPFYYQSHRSLHLDSLAAISNTTAAFLNFNDVVLFHPSPNVYGVAGRQGARFKVALWTESGVAKVSLGGSMPIVSSDMYGNSVQLSSQLADVTPEPTFFAGDSLDIASLVVEQSPDVKPWMPLTDVGDWSRNANSSYALQNEQLRIKSERTQYAYQLVSPPVTGVAGRCYRIRINAEVPSGAIGLFAVDAKTWTVLGPEARVTEWSPGSANIEYLFNQPQVGGDARRELQEYPQPAGSQFRVVLAASNLSPSEANFYLQKAEYAECDAK